MTTKRERPGADNTEALSNQRNGRSEHSSESVVVCHACGALVNDERSRFDTFYATSTTAIQLRKHLYAARLADILSHFPCVTITGLYTKNRACLVSESGLTEEQFQSGMTTLAELNFAFYDEEAELMWVPPIAKFMIGQMSTSDNKVGPALVAAQQAYEDHRFHAEFLQTLAEARAAKAAISGKKSTPETGSGGALHKPSPRASVSPYLQHSAHTSQPQDKTLGEGYPKPSPRATPSPPQGPLRSGSAGSDLEIEDQSKEKAPSLELVRPASVPTAVGDEVFSSELEAEVQHTFARFTPTPTDHQKEWFRKTLPTCPGWESPGELRRRMDRFLSDEAQTDSGTAWIWRNKRHEPVNPVVTILVRPNVWEALGQLPSTRPLKTDKRRSATVFVASSEDASTRITDPKAIKAQLAAHRGGKQ